MRSVADGLALRHVTQWDAEYGYTSASTCQVGQDGFCGQGMRYHNHIHNDHPNGLIFDRISS